MHNRLYIAPKHPQKRAHRDAETHEADYGAGGRDGRQGGGARDVYAHSFVLMVRWAVVCEGG